MLIRLFAYASNKGEAKHIFESIIIDIENNIVHKKYTKNEPYWKMEGIYEVEVNIELTRDFNELKRDEFLKSISDKWLAFGEPIEEVLASNTNKDCKYIKSGIKMINIFY